eukprot:1158376-Pelagomonas_calceolata.AAC.2
MPALICASITLTSAWPNCAVAAAGSGQRGFDLCMLRRSGHARLVSAPMLPTSAGPGCAAAADSGHVRL